MHFASLPDSNWTQIESFFRITSNHVESLDARSGLPRSRRPRAAMWNRLKSPQSGAMSIIFPASLLEFLRL
jgi:hypothetical protein